MNYHNLLRLFILSTCLSITISGYAIGLDLGDHSSVISSVCKRGVRVLTNKIGGRSTPSLGVFMDRERLLGECTAGGLVSRNLKRSITNPRRMISKLRPMKSEEKLMKVSMDENTQVELDTSSQIASFFWHLLEASKSNLKELDGDDVSGTIGCVVSSVPAQFLSSQKRHLENALTIACTAGRQLNQQGTQPAETLPTLSKNSQDQAKSSSSSEFSFPHVGLLTDGAAVALTYGFDRRSELAIEMKSAQDQLKQFESNSKKKSDKVFDDGTGKEETVESSATALAKLKSNMHLVSGRTVCFVDFGYSCLQVTVAKVTDKGAQVLAHTGDNDVCGYKLDELLFELAVEKLSSVSHWKSLLAGDASGGGGLLKTREGELTKAGVRLMEACTKAKVTLSANPVASVVVECLDGDRDAQVKFTREEFEAAMLARNIPDKLKLTCQEAMRIAKLELGSLHSVELLGGCSYIPTLRNLVDVTMTYYKPIHSGVRQTMDPLDSVARGCALSAANLLSHSPHVQSRSRVLIPYTVTDCTAHSLTVYSWVNNQLQRYETIKKDEAEADPKKQLEEERLLPFATKTLTPGQQLPLRLSVEFDNNQSTLITKGANSVVMDIFEGKEEERISIDSNNEEDAKEPFVLSEVNEDAIEMKENKEAKEGVWNPVGLLKQSLAKVMEPPPPMKEEDMGMIGNERNKKSPVLSYPSWLGNHFLGRFYLEGHSFVGHSSKHSPSSDSTTAKTQKNKRKGNKEEEDVSIKGNDGQDPAIRDARLKTELVMDSRGQVQVDHSSFDWSESPTSSIDDKEEDQPSCISKSMPLTSSTIRLANPPTLISGNPGCVLEPHKLRGAAKLLSKSNLKQKMFAIKMKSDPVYDILKHQVDEEGAGGEGGGDKKEEFALIEESLRIFNILTELNKQQQIPQTPHMKTCILRGSNLHDHLLLENQFRLRDNKMNEVESSLNSLEATVYNVKSFIFSHPNIQNEAFDDYFENKINLSNQKSVKLNDDVQQSSEKGNWGNIFNELLSVEIKEEPFEEIDKLSFVSLEKQIMLYKLMKISMSWLEEQPIIYLETPIVNPFQTDSGDTTSDNAWFQELLVDGIKPISDGKETKKSTDKSTDKTKKETKKTTKELLDDFLSSNLVIQRLNKVEMQADKLNSKMLFPLIESNDVKNMFVLMRQKVVELKKLIQKELPNQYVEVQTDKEVKTLASRLKKEQSSLDQWSRDKLMNHLKAYHHMKPPNEKEYDKIMQEIEEKMNAIHDKFKALEDAISAKVKKVEEAKLTQEPTQEPTQEVPAKTHAKVTPTEEVPEVKSV